MSSSLFVAPRTVLRTPEECLLHLDRRGAFLPVSLAARVAAVSEERIYSLVDRQRRLGDVRAFGLRVVDVVELREWMAARDAWKRQRRCA